MLVIVLGGTALWVRFNDDDKNVVDSWLVFSSSSSSSSRQLDLVFLQTGEGMDDKEEEHEDDDDDDE